MTRELLEEICLSKPGATHDIKWGNDLCYLVAEKMFAATSVLPPFQVSLRVLPEEFDTYTERPGISPAPYLARYKWIKVGEVDALSKSEWEHLLEQSYQLTFQKLPKKKQAEILS